MRISRGRGGRRHRCVQSAATSAFTFPEQRSAPHRPTFGILDEEERPTKGKGINDLQRPWISEIAQAQRYKAANQRGATLIGDKISYALIGVDIILALAVGIGIAW